VRVFGILLAYRTDDSKIFVQAAGEHFLIEQ